MIRLMSEPALKITPPLQMAFCVELIKDPSNAVEAYISAAGPV